jgi:predicted unusual protein kinase regulating ubiquinone biosynthesis (AarF/ABC1/UbiB family)
VTFSPRAPHRTRPPRNRFFRFVSAGIVLARLFAGYKLIGLLEKWRGKAWGEKARKRHHRRSAQSLYNVAIRQQGLLIKTLQFLSSRPDIVPDEYIEVFAGLQDRVPPEPFEVIRAVVERELHQPLDAVFSEFLPEAVASASLAQVHRAVLRDGRVAAVKVQYPGIEKLVEGDLKNNDLFIAILNRLDKTLDFSFIAEEMSKMIPRELDFIGEGHNAEQIAANFEGVQDIVVPKIYWEYTTRRVLVMEYVEGVKITDRAGLERAGIDPAEVAKILLVAFSEMLVEHGLFHADPHPGNLMVAPGPKLIMVDFGQVKEVGPQFRFIFGQMTRALLSEDDTELGRAFRALGFRMKEDVDAGYEDLGRAYVGDIAKQMRAEERGWADPDMFQVSYREMLRILRANPLIKIPPDLLFVGRVMGLLNGLSMTLRSKTNLLVEMEKLLDKQDTTAKAGANGGNGAHEPRPRRLLEA